MINYLQELVKSHGKRPLNLNNIYILYFENKTCLYR